MNSEPVGKPSPVLNFLADRFPVEKLNYHHMVEEKRVPTHKMTWGYYTGGLTMFFFMIQVVTGLFLLFYYQPTVSDANISVEYLTHHVAGGALMRNMHAWSSSGMIFSAMLHLLTAFAMKAFEKPREITWITGVLLLLITFTFGFTGYLLPWNQIAVNATKVGLQSVEDLSQCLGGMPPFIQNLPGILRETFQGEASIGQSTLGRFYAMHVVLLPLALGGLLGLHLLCVQLHGMSRGIDGEATKSERFFPLFIVKDLFLWAMVFLVLFTVSLCIPFDCFLPYPLLAPYDPLAATPPGIKPEWYFFFVYYPLELMPFPWIVGLSSVLMAILFLTPWIFKGTTRRTLRSITLAATAYLVIMTLFGEQIVHLIKP